MKSQKKIYKKAVHKKWGSVISGGFAGFQTLPDALVRGQKELGLSPTEMVVLINILMHWWEKDSLPRPRNSAIANRMGVSTRTIERTLNSLERKGYLRRVEIEIQGGSGDTQRAFDLSGLVKALEPIADNLRHYTSETRKQNSPFENLASS